ncbi:unnamed protein product [Closterium sp. Naga37s-1]|nr:unnamed protein product [Closterium sp. Naga37s-1]
MEHSSAFDAVMAGNAGITPSFSDLLGDGSPVAKKVCKAASSSSSKLSGSAPIPVRAANVEVSSAPSLGAPGKRFRRLCAQRDTVGETVTDVERDLDTLVAMIFPEHLAELDRKDIVSFIKKSLCRPYFKNWQIPSFKSMAGDNLKFGKRIYARQILQFPNKEAVGDFRARPPIFFSPPHGPAVELKVYVDHAPDFTAAKARGETHIVLRNIPLGLTEEKLIAILMNGKNREAKALGHSPAANRVKQDLGLLFIGLDSDVEAWTCCACDFICGWTIGTALAHGDTPQHLRRLQTSGPLLKEEFGDLKVHMFLKNDKLVQFLSKE